jgi:hypothetical protein
MDDEQWQSGRSPKVVTGFQVRYQSADESFVTHQTFQPVDGNFYKVESFSPVVFLPGPGFRIDTSIPEAPVVLREGQSFQLNDAIGRGFVQVADRWENPVANEATAG